MHHSKRRNFILEKVKAEGKVGIDKLSSNLNVSSMTIRRDLEQLEQKGEVVRTHGGAVSLKPLITETPFLQKEGENTEQKRQIAKKSLHHIKDGQTIILDSGTTTLEIARLLKTKENITVITNDIKIAAELMDSKLKVIVTGGELQNKIGALFGTQTYRFLKDIHVDLFFLGAHAIDAEAGVTAPTFEKALIKQLMIQSAKSTWIVADSSKLEEKAFSRVSRLEDLAGFITDSNISKYDERVYSNYIKIY